MDFFCIYFFFKEIKHILKLSKMCMIFPFFFQTIPAAFRNGKILGYEINIYNSKTPTRDPEQTHTVHGDGSVTSSTNLLCSSSYIVTLSAFTSKGPSKTPSSISIPDYNSGKVVTIIMLFLCSVVGESTEKNLHVSFTCQTNDCYTLYGSIQIQ